MQPNEVDFVDGKKTTILEGDSLNRQVRVIMFLCPCGKPIDLFVTLGGPFTLEPNNPLTTKKAWTYKLENGTISVSPSIDLVSYAKHPPQCHFYITNWKYKEE